MLQFQFTSVLQNRAQSWANVLQNKDPVRTIAGLLFTIIVSLSAYGLVIGSSHSWTQALSSGIKLPVLYLLTGVVCLPTLVIFCSLQGARQTLTQHFTMLLYAIAAIALIQLGFLPVILFFMITTPESYVFFKLLNVSLFAISGIVGVRFFNAGMKTLLASEGSGASPLPWVKNILRGWGLLFAVVGTQLGWTLRPFFGDPGSEFEWMRVVSGNFYEHLLVMFRSLWM